MAHIRQILANLSISVSDFKKNPKTVIKAVKNEPIAVIINDKPAFYCVPADILESLYQKFYEMNDMTLQNIQELSNSDEQVQSENISDDSFGVSDIFQEIDSDRQPKISNTDALIDPISNNVADPLDEEVANQINNSIDSHLLDSAKKIVVMNTDMQSQFGSLDNLNDNTNLHNVGDLGDLDNAILNNPNLNQNNTLFTSNASFTDSDTGFSGADPDLTKEQDPLISDSDLLTQDPMMTTSSLVKKIEDKATLYEVLKDASQEFQDSKKVKSLVSGPHSFTLEHVAKTYSPYQEHKAHKNELKKEQKLLKKEIKEAKRLAKEAKIKEEAAKQQFIKNSLCARSSIKNSVFNNNLEDQNLDNQEQTNGSDDKEQNVNKALTEGCACSFALTQKKSDVNQIFSHMIHNPPTKKTKSGQKDCDNSADKNEGGASQLTLSEQQALQLSYELVNTANNVFNNLQLDPQASQAEAKLTLQSLDPSASESKDLEHATKDKKAKKHKNKKDKHHKSDKADKDHVEQEPSLDQPKAQGKEAKESKSDKAKASSKKHKDKDLEQVSEAKAEAENAKQVDSEQVALDQESAESTKKAKKHKTKGKAKADKSGKEDKAQANDNLEAESSAEQAPSEVKAEKESKATKAKAHSKKHTTKAVAQDNEQSAKEDHEAKSASDLEQEQPSTNADPQEQASSKAEKQDPVKEELSAVETKSKTKSQEQVPSEDKAPSKAKTKAKKSCKKKEQEA